MTNQDINRICTQYLNDCESELEVQDVFNLAEKALIYKSAIENIRAEIFNLYPDNQCTGELTGYADAIDDVLVVFDHYTKGEQNE